MVAQEPESQIQNVSPTEMLVRMAVERVAGDPHEEQRYLELNFALDRAVERDLRYRELLIMFAEGAMSAPPGESWAWRLAAGLGANLMGDTPAAIWWLEQAGAQLEADGNADTAANSFVHGELARAHYHSGDNAAAIEAANRALQLARSANSMQAEASAHHYLGLISTQRRDYDYARRQINQAKDIFQRMNQRQGRARVLDSLAALELDLGNYEEAQTLLQESLQVKQHLRDLRGQALAMGSMARLMLALGNYPDAMKYLAREGQLTSRVGDERNATLVRVQMGELHLRHGDVEQARIQLLAAEELALQRRNARLEAFARFALAEAERRLGNTTGALEAIDGACDYFLSSDEAIMRERALLRRGLLRGHPMDSPEVQEPILKLRELDAPSALAEALFETATFFRDSGEWQRVTQMYAEALDAAEPAQARQMADVLRAQADSPQGSAWVDAMLMVKEQKDDLEAAYKGLQRSERMRDSLTQMIVHDLKNPLSAIVPWLQTMQMGILSEEETQETMQTVIDECDHLLRMIEDLNDAGKMQHEGGLEITPEPLDLPAMLRDVARRLQARAREGGMEVVVEELPELPAVLGDTNKVRRVLENLTANALKYGRAPESSGRPKQVRLGLHVETGSLETGPGAVRVEVRDFGEGIPLAEADRIFEPYYQAEAGRKRKAGVGLGLAFCRMVVEAHGGSIWCQPAPGGGTLFAFRLPLADG